MNLFPALTRGAHRGAALALTAAFALTAALTAGVSAQTPLVPFRSVATSHHHPFLAPYSREGVGPIIKSGVSFVSAPRYGSAAMRDSLGPFLGMNSTVSSPPWYSVGPAGVGSLRPVSGRVAAIAIDPTDNNTFYVAAAGGGVWKTTDGGNSYVPTSDFLGDTAMGAIAVAPSDPLTIYAGTGEASNSGDSQYGIGLLKSTDGGTTWSLIPGPGNAFYRRAISKIVVSPTDPSLVYLTTTDFVENGRGYGDTGVWKSTDGGTSWTNTTASAGLTSFDPYSDLAMNPTAPDTLYAAIGNFLGSSANGVYKTTDGGTTWIVLAGGLPTANVGRIALALAPSAPGTIYASISDSDSTSSPSVFGSLLGLYKTTDGGATWTQLTAAPNYLGFQGFYDNAIVVSPTNPNHVFAGGQAYYTGALVGSQDGGATFQNYSPGVGSTEPHTDLHALIFTLDGTKLLDGNDGGIWRLENPNTAGGVTTSQWSNLNANLDTLLFTGIALHPTDPTIAYGGSQDNGTEKYTGNLVWRQVRGGDGGFTRVDQSNPNTVYHEYYGISLERSEDGGATWNGATNGINRSDSSAFYVPYKLDPANQSRIIYGTDHVYESVNRGGTFTAIGTPGTAGYNPSDNIVTTLGVYGSTIYAAAYPNLYVTFNDGATWADVSIPNFYGFCSDIYVNPANTLEAYVSRSSFGAGKIYHTTTGGTSWTDISGNLPDEPFNAIVQDPQTLALYAGGDDGVYVSTNTGLSWARFDPTGIFPNVQVVDLALSPGANLLGAGTHGRGLWEMVLSNTISAPTNLIAIASYSQIALKWKTRATYGETYNIYRGTTPGGESATPYITDVTGHTFSDTHVTIGTTYYYTVAMMLNRATSSTSNEASATATTGPPILSVPSLAYPTIQSAINAASSGDVVQVANGTYTGSGNVDLDFHGLSIMVQSLNGAASTIIDCGGTGSAPHRGFLFQTGETRSAIVSGFTIQHANGPDEGAINVAAGSAPTIQNCVLLNNTSDGIGAGISNSGSPTVINCTFSGNVAGGGGYQSGAGIFNGGNITVLNCLFTGNRAGRYAAGIDNNSGMATVTNCVFTDNTATSDAVMVLNFGALTMTNCTSTRNTSGYSAIYNGGTTTLENDLFFNDVDPGSPEIWGTAATANYCDITGGYAGTANIDVDPLFNNLPSDLHLKPGSPCQGAGTVSGSPTTTIDGYTRPTPPSIGAYELSPPAATSTALTSNLNPSAFGQSVTLTATVTGGSPTGAVTFTVDGGNPTTLTLSGGKASFSTSSLSVGSHTVTAVYGGDMGSAGSTSGSLTQTVGPPVLASLAFLTPVPGGTVLSGTVTLSGVTPADVVVGLSSSDSATIRIHRAIIVPAGSSSATFVINTFRSHVTKTVTITANLNGVTLTKDLTITGR